MTKRDTYTKKYLNFSYQLIQKKSGYVEEIIDDFLSLPTAYLVET